MNMKANLTKIVEQIQRQLNISDSYSERRLLQVLENEESRVFSEDGYDFLLVPIEDEPIEEQERLDGLFFSIANRLIESDLNKNYLMIKTQSLRRAVFIPFIADLICKDLTKPMDALEETLKEWRVFWSGNIARLSKIEQTGLLGELLALSRLITCSGDGIVKSWVGPLDRLHDFESEKLDLEIKTTTTQPDSVYISKISQVAPMQGNKELHLIVIGLEEGDEITLPGIIDDIRNKLINSTELRAFEKTLNSSGYRDSDKNHYMHCYGITYIKSHKITSDSPVLNPKVLGEIPSTVDEIKYILLTHAMDMEEVTDTEWTTFGSDM